MIKKFQIGCLPELTWKEKDNRDKKRGPLKPSMIILLGFLGWAWWTSSIASETVTQESVDSTVKEDIELLPAKIDEGYIWEDNWYRFHLWGDQKYSITYNKIDDDSLLNPDDLFAVDEWINELELKLKLDGSIYERIGLLGRGRIGIQRIDERNDTEYDFEDNLDQGYATLQLGEEIITFLSVGKQRIKWGTGFFWNPVDTFNPRQDLQDIERTEEGKVSYRADIAFPSFSLTGVVVPDVESTAFHVDNFIPESDKTLWAGKFYTFLLNTDLTFYVSDRDNEATRWGVSFSTVLSDIQFYGEGIFWDGESEKRYVDLVSDGENKFKIITKDGFFKKFVLGTQYTFSNDVTIIGEYYHRSDGYDNDDMDAYVEFLKVAGGTPDGPNQTLLALGNDLFDFANLRENYFYLSLDKPRFMDRFDLGLNMIVGLDDFFDDREGSLFLRPLLAYVAIPNWRFTFYSQFYIGKDETEFGMLPYNYSLFGEVRYFF